LKRELIECIELHKGNPVYLLQPCIRHLYGVSRLIQTCF
jgi:hypothetical protein